MGFKRRSTIAGCFNKKRVPPVWPCAGERERVSSVSASVAGCFEITNTKMKPKTLIIAVPLVLAASTPDPVAAIAQAEGQAFKQAFNNMPKCAQFCIKNNTAQVGCNMTDLPCQCQHLRPLIVEVAPCMIKEGCEMEQMMRMFRLV